MKLTLERAALLKSLGHVQSVVERRNTIPILSNVKLETKDGELRLNATDMDLDIVESVAAEVALPGNTTAPAHTLYEIVRKLPEGAQVEMTAANANQITLSAGRSNFKLGCLMCLRILSHLLGLNLSVKSLSWPSGSPTT